MTRTGERRELVPQLTLAGMADRVICDDEAHRPKRTVRGRPQRAPSVLGVGHSLTLTAGPAASRPVHLNLDAWSVNTTSTGLVKLTVRELQDQALLERTLKVTHPPARPREASQGRPSLRRGAAVRK